jgi:hypothetical protein
MSMYLLVVRLRFNDSPHPITASVMGFCPCAAWSDMIRYILKLLVDQDLKYNLDSIRRRCTQLCRGMRLFCWQL